MLACPTPPSRASTSLTKPPGSAQQALLALGDTRPVLALVLADVVWQMLFEAQVGAEVAAIQEVLGTDVPIAGGYTLGQVVPGGEGTPQFLNQHMVVIVVGEPAENGKSKKAS